MLNGTHEPVTQAGVRGNSDADKSLSRLEHPVEQLWLRRPLTRQEFETEFSTFANLPKHNKVVSRLWMDAQLFWAHDV